MRSLLVQALESLGPAAPVVLRDALGRGCGALSLSAEGSVYKQCQQSS